MKIQGIKSNAFLPLSIQLHQVFFAIARFLPIRWVSNHWSVVLGDWEYEAIGRGVVKRPYSLKDHHYVTEWEIKLSPQKEVAIRAYLDSLVGKKYEYLNFLYHIIRIWFGKWIGGKNDTFSCIELVNSVLLRVGVNVSSYDSPYETEVRLNRLYGGVRVKEISKAAQFQYWLIPAMKLFATFLVVYYAIKGTLFVVDYVVNYF